MPDTNESLLAGLLDEAGLPAAVRLDRLTGRGFDNEITLIGLADGCRVVLRRWNEPREPEQLRARFLADHDVPAPALLAGNASASLVEFIPGALLGDLIESRSCTDAIWRSVGAAFRRVHAVTFPAGLRGDVEPGRIVLRPVDPVDELHTQLDLAEPGLRRRGSTAADRLAEVHALVDGCADPLRTATTALGHGDINMWNVLVDNDRTTLIDWDRTRVCDPAMEIALLDKHTHLFNDAGLPTAFFDAYGPSAEPNTAIHRVVQTLGWAGSADWDHFETLPDELRHRTRRWLATLLTYADQLPVHLAEIRRSGRLGPYRPAG